MKLEKNYKRKLQLKLLEMLKCIDKLCKENDIEYYLIYGSCLGAIRHNGFIPWDDDLDIGMTDINYKKFLKICEEKLDTKKYYIQTPEKEENYYLSFSKIRDITTTLVEEKNIDKDIVYGVYIDVFPLVGVPHNKIKRILLKINRAFMLSANINIINNKLLKKVFDLILKIVGRKKILKICTRNCFKYNSHNCDKVISVADGDGFEINIIDKKDLEKPKYVKFEDDLFPVPHNPDKYLTRIYGDYLKIPSDEEIKKREHTPYFLDLNLPQEEYKKQMKKKGVLDI